MRRNWLWSLFLQTLAVGYLVYHVISTRPNGLTSFAVSMLGMVTFFEWADYLYWRGHKSARVVSGHILSKGKDQS